MFNPISILTSLVKFNTESSKSNLPLVFFLEKILKNSGFETIIQESRVGSVIKANLVAVKGRGEGGLLLSGHTDTVPAGLNWAFDPWQLVEKQGRFYGLGAVDMKAALTAMVMAACQATEKNRQMKKPLVLVFTFDEEEDFAGVKTLLESGLIKRPDIAIVGEPTNLQPVLAHKGVIALRVDLFGKEAHSSDPSFGLNAIEAASQLILKLKELSLDIKKDKVLVFNPPYSTLNIAKIKGGSAVNKVPDFCSIELEFRTISKYAGQETMKSIKEIVQGLIESKSIVKAEIKETFVAAPMFSSVSKNNLSIIEAVTAQKSTSVSYATEACCYQKYGIPVIVLGPGNIKQAHRANEFIEKADFEKAISVYRQIIEKFCF